ncbi:MAG: hypothetical protein RIC55_33245 [Pirellulaceae bacterium]
MNVNGETVNSKVVRQASRQPRLTMAAKAMAILAALIVSAVFLVPRASLLAQDEKSPAAGPGVESVALGFDGAYKVGYWTPVHITLAGGPKAIEGRLKLVLPDGDGVRCEIVDDEPFSLAAGDKTTLLRYAKFGRIGSEISVALVDADGAAIAAPLVMTAGKLAKAVPATNQLVVTIGRDAGVNDTLAAANRQRAADEQRVAALIDDAARLPDRWYGYEGVDTVVLTTSDGETFQAISDAQLEALDRWVLLGGHLVLCAGAEGEALFRTPGRFARFAPGTFAEVVQETRTGGLEEYARAERIDAGQSVATFRIAMSRLDAPRGTVEAHESIRQQTPAVIRSAHGFGQLTFAAVDLDAPPLSTWGGRSRFLGRLLEATLRRPEESELSRPSGQVSHIGYRDMTGQLRGALDQFAGVTPFAFSWVAGLIIVYILIIGPLDYFFLRKVVGNMAWTWVTFPLAVIGGCALAWYLADVSRGGSVKVNQVDLVDIDVESNLLRGTSWSHVYSPNTQRFDLSVDAGQPAESAAAESVAAGQLLSWQGLPGDAMGGMNTETAARMFNQPYRISSSSLPRDVGPAELTGMPIQVGSSKTLVARWWRKTDSPRLDRLVSRRQTRLLTGTLGNPLDIELKDCVLYYSSWAYVMDRDLAPNQTVTIDELPPPRTLEWHLTRRSVDSGGRRRGEVDDDRSLATAWNRTGGNVPRIMEVMMLHDAAGGATYTGLGGDYQSFVDLSAHLGLDRAILLGRVENPAAELLRDGEPMADDYDRRWTYYRIVLPVAAETISRSNP